MNALSLDPVLLVLAIPALAAAILAALPGYRATSLINAAASFLTLLAALSLLIERPETGRYLLVADLNIVFVVLNTFVGFTTSVLDRKSVV